MIKNFTRILAVMLILSMTVIFPISASAATNNAAYASVTEDGMLSVYIASDNADVDNYTIYVMDKANALEFTEGSSAKLEGLKMLEQEPSEFAEREIYGYTQFTQKLNGVSAGTELMVIISGKTKADDMEVLTVYPENQSAGLEALRVAAKSGDLETVLKEKNNSAWSVDLSNIAYTSNKSSVLNKLKEIIKAEPENDDVAKMFNTACVLAMLEACDEDSFYPILLANQKYLELENCSDIIKKERKPAIAIAFVNLADSTDKNESYPINTTEDLEDILYGAEALGELNLAVGKTEITNVLDTYNDKFFKLDLDTAYKKVGKAELARQLQATDEDTYTSKTQVADTVKEIVKNAGNDGGGSGGSGGSGGGSYSGGGGILAESGADTSIVDGEAALEEGFKDIGEAEWAEPYITYLKDKGVLTGDGDGGVRPNDSITREEFVKLILTALNPSIPEDAAAISFTDVTDGEWYTEYITNAVKAEIVNGISENTFGVGSFITRQDAAVMVYRAINAKKAVLAELTEKQEFTDSDKIADYAKLAVSQLQMGAVLSGYEDGAFLPENNISRAESAKIIYTVLKNINEL